MENITENPRVDGSNPSLGTMYNKASALFGAGAFLLLFYIVIHPLCDRHKLVCWRFNEGAASI